MKRQDFLAEISKLGLPELREKAAQLGEEQMKLRFRAPSGQLEKPHQLQVLKLNKARVLTEIRKRELAQAGEAAAAETKE